MRIHQKDGFHMDIPVQEIDSITFVSEGTVLPTEEANLTGQWFWGNHEAGYYEVLSFNEDHTYTAYDKYFEYDFDTMTYGWYFQHGSLLTLQSNGFGYKRIYKWFVSALTGNALEVMTKMGPFTYYKLQSTTLRLQTGSSLSLEENESIIFTDSIIVKFDNGVLYGIMPGETYILKRVYDSIFANKVIVE